MNSSQNPQNDHEIHAKSFGQAADLYDAVRPSYPEAALNWAFGSQARDIADVGAGTGLLSRGLISAGHRVTAIEPDKQMLDKLISITPQLAGFHNCGAENIPVPDASFDSVTAGQSYHWFDPIPALNEIKRILRPGGTFVAMWNVRDESFDWVKALTTVVGSSAAELTATMANRPGYFAPAFPNVQLRVFRHEKPFNATGLRRLVKTRSYYLTADESRKQEILSQVNEIIESHPQLAGRETFAMPYVTHVFSLSAE